MHIRGSRVYQSPYWFFIKAHLYFTTSNAAEVQPGGFHLHSYSCRRSKCYKSSLWKSFSGRISSLGRMESHYTRAFNVITLSRPIDVKYVIMRISINTVKINKTKKVISTIIKDFRAATQQTYRFVLEMLVKEETSLTLKNCENPLISVEQWFIVWHYLPVVLVPCFRHLSLTCTDSYLHSSARTCCHRVHLINSLSLSHFIRKSALFLMWLQLCWVTLSKVILTFLTISQTFVNRPDRRVISIKFKLNSSFFIPHLN